MRQARLLALAAALALALLGNTASACDADCSADLGCFGSCSITPEPPCGAICWSSGCNATCRQTGRLACSGPSTEVNVNCTSRPPVNSPAHGPRPAGWAVLHYEVPATGQSSEGTPQVIDSSSADIAEESVIKLQEQLAAQVMAARENPGPPTAPSRPEPMVRLHVEPGDGGCVKVTPALFGSELPDAARASGRLLFRATVTAEGRLGEVETLWTDHAKALPAIESFLLENFYLKEVLAPAVPALVFGFLTTGESGVTGLAVTAVRE